jgi:FlaA1/EpsC-like NDP-sugar epimerase
MNDRDRRSDDVVQLRPTVPSRVAAKLRRNVPLMVLDLAVVFTAYFVPLVLRFGGTVPEVYWDRFWRFGAMAAILHLLANYFFGLYGQMWRFASVLEARRLLLAGAVAGPLVIAADVLLGRGSQYILPLSGVVVGAVLSVVGFGALRFQARLFGLRRREAVEGMRRVLIVGAGEAGAIVLADLVEHPQLGLDPVGVIDDDRKTWGASLKGVRVYGGRPTIQAVIRRFDVDEVLLAIPSATSELVRDVAARAEECEVPLRVLPARHDVVGKITARDIRDLRIEDLLGRLQVETDLETVSAMLQGRRVLVTGAGGSIGAEICRQVATFDVEALCVLDHDETHLHDLLVDLERDMRVDLEDDGHVELADDPRVEPILADIRDAALMISVFERFRPDVVFHAAAHKHVPILETHPSEAVLTNVLGTANFVEAAVCAGARRFVLISTDKAVNTTNVMGASKRFAEQIVGGRSDGRCVMSAVRFGNVLGSRGSVIPTFLRQIERGGPVTVTDPAMTRYFMSVREAVQLVLQAGALAEGGEVFTLEMGEPVNILELARRLVRLAGRVPGRDISVEIVGTRPGEKLVEELVAEDEELRPTVHPGIAFARPPRPQPARLHQAVRELETLVAIGDASRLAERMKALATEPSALVGAGADE